MESNGDAWCLVPGVWYLVPGVLVSGVWCMVPGGACHCRAVNATAWAADCATYSIDGALSCVT